MFSSCLYGRNVNEFFYILTGSGRNGKGLLAKWVKAVLGSYYFPIQPSQLTQSDHSKNQANSELADCRFARLVMASEPDDDNSSSRPGSGNTTSLKIATLKKWSGGDEITARFLHGQSFTFDPHFSLMLQCNGPPALSVKDDAIARRMKIIELPFTFVENKGQELEPNQKYLKLKLKEQVQQPHLRNGLLHILLDVFKTHHGKFIQSRASVEFTKEYLEDQNQVRKWFEENYEHDPEARLKASDIHTQAKNELEFEGMNSKVFGRLLKETTLIPYKQSGTNPVIYHCKRKVVQDQRFFNR
jgi:putative DNA primase/helicase